jgi:hypothetical protein
VIERRVATTVTSVPQEVLSADPAPPVPDATPGAPLGHHATGPIATTPRARIATARHTATHLVRFATPDRRRTFRNPDHRARTTDATAHLSAPDDLRDRTPATTRVQEIADRVCRHEIARRAEAARNDRES